MSMRKFLQCRCLLCVAVLTGALGSGVSDGLAAENEDCLGCHAYAVDGTPTMSAEPFASSVHGILACVDCHVEATEIPHPVAMMAAKRGGTKLCQSCHEEQTTAYSASVHGVARKDRHSGMADDAANCYSCHGEIHSIFPADDPRSSVYHLNLPRTCGACHSDPEMAQRHGIPVDNAYQLYMDSIHGRAVMKSGLMVAANCSDCHGSHTIQPGSNPASSVHRDQILETCGRCHVGVVATLQESVHGTPVPNLTDGAEMPVCTNCHRGHQISMTDTDAWKLNIVEGCGHCHQQEIETYRHSYHGKITSLGYTSVARCSDCHGSHNIWPSKDARSQLFGPARVETCAQCHEGASESFTQYLPHADYKDRQANPALYFTYVGFTALLIVTFVFWGLHSLLWCIRSALERRRHGNPHPHKVTEEGAQKFYWRFDAYHRVTHALIIVSFLGLAATGIPLKFSDRPWAVWLSHLLGGFETAGFIHRCCAILTVVYCAMHLGFVGRRVFKERRYDILWGAGSLVPQPSDAIEFWNHVKWFVGFGPRPKFGRWTYWEKFDYWAVFWGVAIIGCSGLVLWFPTFFAHFFPGWVINVATIIHSDEALLAIGFIFTIHFFNGHFRPEKFPMDTVMFTGRLTLEELQAERPAEYAALVREGTLDALEARSPDRWVWNIAKWFGFAALAIGVLLILLILLVW